MRFPLKVAASAILVKTIFANITHLPQVPQNEVEIKFPRHHEFNNQEVSVTQAKNKNLNLKELNSTDGTWIISFVDYCSHR